MNLLDNENKIIEMFQDVRKDNVYITNRNKNLINVFKCIYNKKRWQHWKNSSGKSDLPPDYYSDKFRLMMDVMRIDDHAFVDENGKVYNPHNKRESVLRKEIESKNPNLKKASLEGRLIINPITNLSSEEDHNYLNYVNNFKRVVEKHIEKIPIYNKNHEGHKLIFFICDESSPYFENLDIGFQKSKMAGEVKKGNSHLWWEDNNMIRILKNTKIDYLIWYTPYKWFESFPKITLPKVVIFDISKIDLLITREIDSRKMESLEV